jgi:hypothetical protein
MGRMDRKCWAKREKRDYLPGLRIEVLAEREVGQRGDLGDGCVLSR